MLLTSTNGGREKYNAQKNVDIRENNEIQERFDKNKMDRKSVHEKKDGTEI